MALNYIEINKKLWNKKTEIHYHSEFYDVEGFIRGKDSLNPVEIQLLGDIKEKTILHLQCHFGQDTLSLSRRGALVTGVDFSDKAIEKARQLNEQLNANARFIQSDIYQLPGILNEKFDMVYTSYGVVGWLPDMTKWAQIIHRFLKPHGEFIMVEFHPIVWMFSDDFKNIAYNYLDSGPIIEETEGTYADPDAPVKEKSVGWNHGLSKVIDSLLKAGLTLTDFKEYNYSPYNCFKNMTEVDDRKFKIKGLEDKIPLIYSIMAKR